MDSNFKEDLKHIREVMDKSSRFISLSGLSGVSAGVIALIGGGIAMYLLHENGVEFLGFQNRMFSLDLVKQLVLLSLIVLGLALLSGYYFTQRRTKNTNTKLWNKTSKLLLKNLLIPLVAGGIFCIGLLYHNSFFLIAPAMLIFYGLALLNAAKYTLGDIHYLGICEVVLGLIATFFLGYGLVFWMIGFGILHIVYGILMFNKYERT